MAENNTQPVANQAQSLKPGETISPTASAQPVAASPITPPAAVIPPAPPVQAPAAPAAAAPAAEPPRPAETPASAPVVASPEPAAADSPPPATGPEGTISWTASEFIAHQKSTGWYVRLGLAAVVLAALIWLLTRGIIPPLVILICGFVLGFYASRQPRQLPYRLDDQGIMIGQKFFGYENFRSFAIMQEGAFDSLVFMPLKRFSQLTTIYYAPELADQIVDFLADRLPMEERQPDTVDRFMSRIRF